MSYFRLFSAALLLTGTVGIAPAQILLSDFEDSMEGTDGWSGTINGNTPYANGSTAESHVAEGSGWVLNLQDGGYAGGASRVYGSLAPEQGVVTLVADLRIVTDPNTLTDTMAFGIKMGSGTGTTQGFAYSKSRGSGGDDSNQQFVRVAASVVTGPDPIDITAAVTPDKMDWAVGLGTWVIQVDNVYKAIGGTVESLDTFDATNVGHWTQTSDTNSPFVAGTTTISHVTNSTDGAVQIQDGGYGGGAVGVYPNAVSASGVHTVLADVRIVTDPGTLAEARIAAAPGTTTNIADLSWSSSFATSADDTGQAFATVAVPFETAGQDDLALYVLPDYDASVSLGTWQIQVDNVQVITSQAAPVSLSGFSLE